MTKTVSEDVVLQSKPSGQIKPICHRNVNLKTKANKARSCRTPQKPSCLLLDTIILYCSTCTSNICMSNGHIKKKSTDKKTNLNVLSLLESLPNCILKYIFW